MNLTPMLAEAGGVPWMTVVLAVGALLFVFFVFAVIWASRYTKVGPNQVLVVSGRKHAVVEPDGTSADVAASASSRAAARSSVRSSKRWTCFRSNC